jgi:hypothetical protein
MLRESDEKDDRYGYGTRCARRRDPERPATTRAPLLRATAAAFLEVFGRWRAQFWVERTGPTPSRGPRWPSLPASFDEPPFEDEPES